MASKRQMNANRRNAKKSTGPKTPEGKRVSRMNALKHGMAAHILVLPHEDELEFTELRQRLIASCAPANDYELMLVDQIAAGYWRTMRARAYETEMLNLHVEAKKCTYEMGTSPQGRRDDQAAIVVFDAESNDRFQNYFRYDGLIERAYYRALSMLERTQARRFREERQRGSVSAHHHSEHTTSPVPAPITTTLGPHASTLNRDRQESDRHRTAHTAPRLTKNRDCKGAAPPTTATIITRRPTLNRDRKGAAAPAAPVSENGIGLVPSQRQKASTAPEDQKLTEKKGVVRQPLEEKLPRIPYWS